MHACRATWVDRALLLLLAGMLWSAVPVVRAEEPADDPVDVISASLLPLEEIVTWRVEFDNDIVFNSDNQFTNGWSLQKHGPPARDWTDAGGTLAFGKGMAKWFLPHRRTDLFFREGWIIGQNMQTPDDLAREDLIVDDVPYVASLAVQNSWIAFDDKRFHGFGWLLGIAGPAALGEETQKGFHELIGADEPMGWEHQLGNEPLFNLYFEQKRKLWNSPYADVAVGFGAQAGNLITGADVAVETRFGWHLPDGFVYIPDPVGRSLSYDSHLAPANPANPAKPIKSAFYGSLTLRGSAAAHVLYMDGNTFSDSHSVERETAWGTLIAGLHYQRWRWGIHLHLWFTTDTVDPETVSGQPDTTSDFGSLMFEFRF